MATWTDGKVADARAILARGVQALDARRLATLDRLLAARPLPSGRTGQERAQVDRALNMILTADAPTLDAIERQIA